MKNRNQILRVIFWAGLCILIALYIVNPSKAVSNLQKRELLQMFLSRAAAVPVLLSCAILLRFHLVQKPKAVHLFFLLPALIVAFNNFPWLPLLNHSARLENKHLIILLILQVLAVATMEEIAFRGILLPLLLERIGKTKKGIWLSILLSSVVFGLIHFVNLIESPNLPGVFMQVGYSMLLGALCAVLLLGTGNILYCIAVHAVYNFGGGATAYLIAGTVWNLPNILLTVILSVAVGIWYLLLVIRMRPANLPDFQKSKNLEKDGTSNA